MNYRPLPDDALGVHVPVKVAPILLSLMPDVSEIERRAQTLRSSNEAVFLMLMLTLDRLRAARHANSSFRSAPGIEAAEQAPGERTSESVPSLRESVGDPRVCWISTEQAAERAGVSARYVRRLLEEGRLDGQKVAGTWAVSVESLNTYMRMREAA